MLDGFNPPQAEFKALREKLAELRNGKTADSKAEDKPAQPRVHVPEGKILRPGMKDARVAALRKRLDVAGDKDNQLYDDAVRDAVKTFQTESDIGVDGNLGPNTVRALNGEQKEAHRPSANPVDTIIVNMERWRWYPRDLGNPHVVVNIPDYSLSLFNDGKVYWKTRIVVGKPDKATPLVSAEMKFITVNPTWNVPPSIIEKEYLPALQEDPQALDRIGLKLTQDADGTVHISQPPGAGNALGRIRFNFPNKFLVYQHDTPDKYLFARDKRAYSHGCMRVQNPLTYGEKLLSLVLPKEHYTEARLESMFGGSEININFPKFIPVHLTYQTAFVDDAGKLQLRDDVYGRDAKMIGDPQEQRAQGCRPRGRARAEFLVQAGAHAGRNVWRQQQRLQRRRIWFLRLDVRRRAGRPTPLPAAQRPDQPARQRQRPLQRPLNRKITVNNKRRRKISPAFCFDNGHWQKWYRRVDLNHRPLVPQTSALTN